MSRQKAFIKKFNVDTSYLNKEEVEVLGKLVEAAELVADIYALQLKDGFYPLGATRQEIEKAASDNPEILSPFTVVERDKDGKLIAIPYHKKYRELLLPIAKKLQEASEIASPHPDFRKALLIQAKALLDGNYQKAQITWIKIKPYTLDIVIGPIERVEDNMFFVKRSYESWVGVRIKNITDRINTLKDIVFSARRHFLPSERVDFMEKAQLRADDIIIFSGMIANYNYTATTLPNEIDILEKYGSEGWIFLQSIKNNFEHGEYKVFDLIFAPFFKNSFSKEMLFRGYLLMVAMHEIARIVIRYRFAVDRLREFYPIFNELTIEAVAVKMMGMLLLKDVISQKELEAVLVMFLTRLFDGYTEDGETLAGFKPLVLCNTILLNSLVEAGAVRVTKEGISWPNFTKMFISVSDLADNMEKILAEGTYSDAEKYLKNHSSLAVFKKFSPALKTLHCD